MFLQAMDFNSEHIETQVSYDQVLILSIKYK